LPANGNSPKNKPFFQIITFNPIDIPMKNNNLKMFLWFFLCFCLSLLVAGYEVTVGGIKFEIADGKATVIGLEDEELDTVVIPAEVNGVPVTAIGNSTFYCCFNLSSVTLPKSLTSIGESAFEGCSNLSDIAIPEGVISIGNYAFDSCQGLTSVVLPQTLTSLGEGVFAYCGNLEELVVAEGNDNFVVLDGVLFNADMTRLVVYPAGKAGDAYYIPDNVTVLDNYSFTWCDLTSVHIPNSVVSIGSDAFWACDGLTSIMIPESVTGIGERAFGACDSLTEIVVSEDNKDFVSVDGVLFNAAGTRLIAYPAGKINETYAVPATVTHIDSWAFFTCEKLTDVFVPYGVSYIGNQAFDYCTNLTSIIISNGVTEIGYSPFYDSLETVFTDNEYVMDWFYYNMPYVSIWPFSESGYDDLHQPLPEADAIVTGEDVTMSTSGDAPWFLQENIFQSAPSAMQSGAIDHNGVSTLTARVTGPGVLSFYWKVSSESGWDFLSFSIDGVKQESISGEKDWVKSGYALGEGAHEVSWTYAKDYMDDYESDDCGWVDDIVWPDNDYVPPYDIVSGGIVYRIADGEATVTGVEDKTITDVVLLEKVDGHPVTSIGDGAFYGCERLTSVILPASLTSIGALAFLGCSNLSALAIPYGVTSIGNWAFAYSSLTEVIIPDGVTSIGERAFYDCSSLTSLVIPNGVTSIGEGAFEGCQALSTVFTDSEYVADWFYYNMPTVSIRPFSESGYDDDQPLPEASAIVTGEDVTMSTGGNAHWFLQGDIFHSAPSAMQSGAIGHNGISTLMARVTGPGVLSFYWKVSSESGYDFLSFSVDGVVQESISGETDWAKTGYALGEGEHEVSWTYAKDYVDDYESADCGWVDDIVWPDNDYVPPYDIFSDGIVFRIADGEATVTGVEVGTITYAVIPEIVDGCPVTSIGDGAFSGCEGLTSVTLPASLTSIGYNAFGYCTSLSGIAIPEGVTSIGDWAFGYCEGMTSVTLPASLTSIGEGAFTSCTSLPEITVAEGNENFVAVDGVLFDAEMTSLRFYPAGKTDDSYAVPETVTAIVDGAFYNCSGLTSVTLPASLTSIGRWAFGYCEGLTSVTLPASLTFIGDYAFYGCQALSTVFTDSEYVADWFAEHMPGTVILPRDALPVSVQRPLAIGWNLVGIPLALDAASKEAIAAYRPLVCDYSAKANVYAEATYAPGTAVWLFATKDDMLILNGTPVQSVGTVLQKGWSLVSPLYGETANPGLDQVWYWTPEGMQMLKPEEGVEPGTGYWIYSDETQTIW